jgi:hypothetical protein
VREKLPSRPIEHYSVVGPSLRRAVVSRAAGNLLGSRRHSPDHQRPDAVEKITAKKERRRIEVDALPPLLQQLLDRGPEALRRGIRGETGDRVACPVDQELGEVPFDGPGTEQPAFVVLQELVKRMGA